MTLSKSLQKRFVFATAVFLFIGTLAFGKGVTLSGKIINSDGDKVKKAMVTLLSGGEVVKEASFSFCPGKVNLNLRNLSWAIMSSKHPMMNLDQLK